LRVVSRGNELDDSTAGSMTEVWLEMSLLNTPHENRLSLGTDYATVGKRNPEDGRGYGQTRVPCCLSVVKTGLTVRGALADVGREEKSRL
jgi:hypothetical protein